MSRFLLPAAGGILAWLAVFAHAQGQTQPAGAGASQSAKVRILAASAPPLADEQLPDGGLVLALISASLKQPGAGPDSTIRWTNEAFTAQVLNDPAVDYFLPVESTDCDRPSDLTQGSAIVCDNAVFSEPILQVVLGLFTLTNSTFKFETDQSIFGKTVCLSRDHDLTALNGNGRNWASYKRVVVARRATLLDCVAAVQAHDADAFAATDLEGAYLLRRLGLTPYFVMQARPLATRGLHAVVSRGHARGAELVKALNQGLKRLKGGDAYSAIIQKHLVAAVAPPAGTPVAAAPPPAPPRAALPAPVQRPAKAAPPPVLDPTSRETALKFLRRGNEELAEGRVAPARLLYERAAEMGLAQAAMALAGTYDAAELNQPHLRNVLPDAAEAARWYQRARALGAADADARLRRLGSK
jgi:hypothetical protein